MSSRFVPSDCFAARRKKTTLPLFVVSVSDYPGWLDSAPPSIKQWLKVARFSPKAGASSLLPSDNGPAGAVVTVDDESCHWQYANLPRDLPLANYEAEPELGEDVATALAMGWALGSYRYEVYKKRASKRPTLVWPEAADQVKALALVEGICLARDLVNAPASDMGPEELAAAAKAVAKQHGATITTIVGDALLKKNYPMIHAVGRASTRAPRLVDFTWGNPKHPRVTLVGKGVCFDTGGLDIKPAPYMKLMKKDMGGAALVLGLAHALMARGAPIRLRVLIPAVENSVSGNAMRPLDVLNTRKGITVEVGDTDAEGRLILADALVEADSESPELIIDAATLTGAARVALGTGMPAIFTSNDSTWRAIEEACDVCADPVWRMPLHHQYRSKLSSKVADLASIGPDGYAGAILAALFLNEFVSKDRDWVHMDTMGYNLESRPGRPVGGEALGLLTLEAMVRERFPTLEAPSAAESPKLTSTRQESGKKKARDSAKKSGVKKSEPRSGSRPGPRKANPRSKS